MSKDASRLQRELVEHLKTEGALTLPEVEAAFRGVPRHLFLPDLPLEEVYRDEAIPTKFLDGRPVSSSSQPAIMAIMLEQLALQPGQRVLEIGAGTGYNAALMAHMVRETGQVITLDIDEDITAEARAHLHAAGFDQVQVVCADGGLGYPEAAPYDRIILTVGAWDIAPAWWGQLQADGRLVLPLSIGGPQKSVAFARAGEPADHHLESISIRDCGFMRLRGAFAGPERLIALGPEEGLCLSLNTDPPVEAGAIYEWLRGPGQEWATGVQVTAPEIWQGLSLWLALREPGLCDLTAQGEAVECGLVPGVFVFCGQWKSCATLGVLEDAGLCLLARPRGLADSANTCDEMPADRQSFSLMLRSLGPGAQDGLAQRLAEQITAWDAAGRPGSQGMRIRVYPPDSDYAPIADETLVRKRWTQLVVDWREA